MKPEACILALLCLAAALPPLPAVPKRNHPHKSAAVHQGAGAAKLIARIVPSVSTTNTFTWLYPPGVNPSQFWWDLEQATSPNGPWSTLVTNASGAFDVHVNKSQALSIYRLRAKLTP